MTGVRAAAEDAAPPPVPAENGQSVFSRPYPPQEGVCRSVREESVAELSIRPVDTRSEQKRFVRLPWRIYRDDPCWMPPLVMSQEELLGFRRHPFLGG